MKSDISLSNDPATLSAFEQIAVAAAKTPEAVISEFVDAKVAAAQRVASVQLMMARLLKLSFAAPQVLADLDATPVPPGAKISGDLAQAIRRSAL